MIILSIIKRNFRKLKKKKQNKKCRLLSSSFLHASQSSTPPPNRGAAQLERYITPRYPVSSTAGFLINLRAGFDDRPV